MVWSAWWWRPPDTLCAEGRAEPLDGRGHLTSWMHVMWSACCGSRRSLVAGGSEPLWASETSTRLHPLRAALWWARRGAHWRWAGLSPWMGERDLHEAPPALSLVVVVATQFGRSATRALPSTRGTQV